MKRGRVLTIVLGGTVAIAAVAFSATQALATPPTATGLILGRATIDEHIAINPSREVPSIVTVQKVTIPPGGTTGWHSHEAEVLAVVAAGTLTLRDHDCSVRTIAAGAGVVENPGHVHEARNLGTSPVDVYVTYVSKPGAPLRVDEADPGC